AVALNGLAYDSSFKESCGKGQSKTGTATRVLAPFGFISVLAGAMLAIEMVQRDPAICRRETVGVSVGTKKGASATNTAPITDVNDRKQLEQSVKRLLAYARRFASVMTWWLGNGGALAK
ncbi:hypothetical protein OY671_011714, partial [Metschnikowia pulcherrima]